MMSRSRNRGFTLVELLVVMTIITVAMSLVGGLAMNGYTKFQAKSEVMTIERLVHQANIHAFATEQPLTLELKQNSAVLNSEVKQVFSKSFDYMQFPTETIVFNRKGIPSKTDINVRVSGKTRKILLVTGN